VPLKAFEVHGHRGARALFPENTLAGFEYALAAGADFIELDVTVTRDDVLVVCHDAVLKRRCRGPRGTRVVRKLTLGQLRQFDIGTRTNRRFRRQARLPGVTIPTLGEVFALARRGEFRFNIEVKACGLEPEAYARMVVEAVERNRLERRVRVTSFDLEILRAVARTLPIGALSNLGQRDFLARALAAGSQTAGPYHRLATPRRVAEAHAAGVRVVPWTANRPRDWARLIRAGVDGIITDDPAGLLEYLKNKGLRV
jgi:glycerophosphoryl diester phosphodiesterase